MEYSTIKDEFEQKFGEGTQERKEIKSTFGSQVIKRSCGQYSFPQADYHRNTMPKIDTKTAAPGDHTMAPTVGT